MGNELKNSNLIMNREVILKNIYDKATEHDRNFIKDILARLQADGVLGNMARQEADKLIKKYRPEYFEG